MEEKKILALLESLVSKVDRLETEMNRRFDIVDADMKTVLNFALNAEEANEKRHKLEEEANEKRHKELFQRLEEVTYITQVNTYDIAVLKGTNRKDYQGDTYQEYTALKEKATALRDILKDKAT